MWYRASNLQNLYAPRKSSAGRQTLSPRFRFTARNVALPERVPLTDCGSRPQDTRHRQRPDVEIVGAEHFGPLSLVSLFDHLVGEREQLVGNGQAERLGGLEVDHQFEFCWLQHRQIGGLGALQKATRVNSRLTIGILDAGAVTDESARSDVRRG